MNLFSFIGLMRSIYGKKLPDLNKIQDKGLLAVKIAQHFALRIDFLDEKVCSHLSKLFTSARPAKGINGKQLVQKFVSKEWFDNFSYFEEEPFAAASVGQVHYGTLKNGDSVVVKVLKDDFKNKFLKDLKTLRNILKAVLFFAPKLKKVFDPMSILEHIEEYTISELDLKNEVAGMEKLEEISLKYQDLYDLSLLRLPYFYKDLSNSNVLVSEKINGNTFDDLLKTGKISYKNILDLFKVHGLFIFGVGIFHGDLHPGNVILGDDGKIYFIDTGALSSSQDKMRKGLFDFFTNLTRYDYGKCAYSINNMADKKISGEQFRIFESKFFDLYKDFKNKTVSEVSLTKKMMDTIKLGVNSGMEFDHGMFPIIKSLMYLDGMVLRCNPDALLINDMKPFVENFKELINLFR